MNVSEFVWHRLSEWGLSRVYGYPGDGVGGLDVAIEKAKDKIEYVQVRHEEMAAFMASAHAKFTGQPGVCYATSGPGAIHLLNGLYDAKMDHVPVVALVGQQARSAIGASYQQEVDLQTLFQDVAEYVGMASVPEQVRHLIDRAVRIAHNKRAVTCVILPNDLQELDYKDPPMAHGATHTGVGYAGPAKLPDESLLRAAAEVLNSGSKVAMLVGAGALEATDEVIAVAERLQAGVAKALLGKAALPDDLPFVTGSIGLLGTKPSWDLMKNCDTLLMVGSSFPYSEFLPKPGAARGVQIDIDGSRLSLRYPMEVNMVGDSATTLRALLPLLKQKKRSSWREDIEDGVSEWWKMLENRAMNSADPLNPQRVFWELSPRLPDNAIITANSGSVGQLVRARPENATRDEGFPIGRPGFARCGDALRRGWQNGLSRPDRDRLHGRRCDADERDQRDDHDREILETMVQSAPDRAGAQQPRPQPGDMGRAHPARRRQDRIHPEHSGFSLPQICRADRAEGDLRRQSRQGRSCLGRRHYRPIGRSSSKPTPIRTCRRFRRISRSRMPRTSSA